MTTGLGTITLMDGQEIATLLNKKFPGLEHMEVCWGLPFLNSDGEMCIEIAFSDEGTSPKEWSFKPLAVKQGECQEKVARLLLSENLDEINKIAALAR